MNIKNQPTIGIIGAGASGLVSAWLLEQNHHVILFEKENYLGGHVATVPVTINGTTWPVEAGAEFFSDMMFPEFNRLLALLKVPVRKYPLTYTFYNTKSGHTLVLPPVQEDHVIWRSCTPAHWFDLIHFKRFVDEGAEIVAMGDYALTLKDYVDELGLPDAFKEHFLYPFFAASWGVSCQEIQQFAAYDLLKWALLNKPANLAAAHWSEIVGGMSNYVTALVNQLTNTTIYTDCNISAITHENNQYHIYNNNQKTSCDHLIIATNAHTAAQFLSEIPSAHPIKNILQTIEYFSTHIAIHGDRRLLPKDKADWSTANIAYDTIHSALTISKPWMQEIPLFRSWITYNLWFSDPKELPQPLYALRSYQHPRVTPAYFAAQKALAKLQGKNNLWIAGFYTHDTDSHNSAVVSAINIAKQLASHSDRFCLLTQKI